MTETSKEPLSPEGERLQELKDKFLELKKEKDELLNKIVDLEKIKASSAWNAWTLDVDYLIKTYRDELWITKKWNRQNSWGWILQRIDKIQEEIDKIELTKSQKLKKRFADETAEVLNASSLEFDSNNKQLQDINWNVIDKIQSESIDTTNAELFSAWWKKLLKVWLSSWSRSKPKYRLVDLDTRLFVSWEYDKIEYDNSAELFIVTDRRTKKYMKPDSKILWKKSQLYAWSLNIEWDNLTWTVEFSLTLPPNINLKYSISKDRFESNDKFEVINPESQDEWYLFVKDNKFWKIHIIRINSNEKFSWETNFKCDELLSNIETYDWQYVKVKEGNKIYYVNIENWDKKPGWWEELLEIQSPVKVWPDYIFKWKETWWKECFFDLSRWTKLTYSSWLYIEADKIWEIQEFDAEKYVKITDWGKESYVNLTYKNIVSSKSNISKVKNIQKINLSWVDKHVFKWETDKWNFNYYDLETWDSIINNKKLLWRNWRDWIHLKDEFTYLSDIQDLDGHQVIYIDRGHRKYFDLSDGKIKKIPKQKEAEKKAKKKWNQRVKEEWWKKKLWSRWWDKLKKWAIWFHNH